MKDAWGIPVLDFHCKYGENEVNMAKDAVATLEEVCHAAKFEVLNGNDKMVSESDDGVPALSMRANIWRSR